MEPPLKPEESECCNSGCNPCIFDVYEKQLKVYEQKLKTESVSETKNYISPIKCNKFKLIKKCTHTHDTFIFIFECGTINKETSIILDPGQHFFIKAFSEEDNKYISRAYTPIPYKLSKHQFAVLIKLYEKGKMSRIIHDLEINSMTLWRGPYGDFSVNYNHENILFIAQGTGIAPIYSIICDILSNESCDSRLMLYFACRNFTDFLLHTEIYDLKMYWNFMYETFLSGRLDGEIKYNEIIHENRLSEEHLKIFLKDKVNCQVLICGSEAFNNCFVDYLRKCNVHNNSIHIF